MHHYHKFLLDFILKNYPFQLSELTFQPKGADRKHKTDREKMEKRTESEKVRNFIFAEN